jgi:hypothetical protein
MLRKIFGLHGGGYEEAFLRSVIRFIVTANIVPSSSILTRATRRNIPEDGIHHN